MLDHTALGRARVEKPAYLTFAGDRSSTMLMLTRHLLRATVTLFVGLALLPATARAQYKNSAFGLDVGYWTISKPTVQDASRVQWYTELDKRPLRLDKGMRIGGQSNFKLDEDHLWFAGGINVGFLQFPSGKSTAAVGSNDLFDFQASDTLGTILAVEPSMGLRYVFLTDRIRPYLQVSASYLRLMTFSSVADQDCTSQVCQQGNTNQQNYLPHANVGVLHLQPGVEVIFKRDIALHLFFDLQRWVIYNADDNVSAVLGLGLVFFT
jgi:hypothetical protein